MKKYFYTDGTNNLGPFTIEELKEKNITRDTNIWVDQLGEWKKAGTIQELNELFALTPSTLQKQSTDLQATVSRDFKVNKLDIFACLSLAYWFIMSWAQFFIQKFIDRPWIHPAIKYFDLITIIIFAFTPFIFALTIKDKKLKFLSIIFAALILVYMLYTIIYMLIPTIYANSGACRIR